MCVRVCVGGGGGLYKFWGSNLFELALSKRCSILSMMHYTCVQITFVGQSLNCRDATKFYPNVFRVRINGSLFAICEAFLRICETNFIQKYKIAKLIKILKIIATNCRVDNTRHTKLNRAF